MVDMIFIWCLIGDNLVMVFRHISVGTDLADDWIILKYQKWVHTKSSFRANVLALALNSFL